MWNIAELRSNVQGVIDFQTKQHKRKMASNNEYAAKKHFKTASDMAQVAELLDSLPVDENGFYPPQNESAPCPQMELDLFSISESELSQMPDSLKEALKLSQSDELETKIVELIKIAGRPLSVKELIIGLYKKYQYEVTDRNPFASKLYRMNQAGRISSVKGKKGYYFLPDQKQTVGSLKL